MSTNEQVLVIGNFCGSIRQLKRNVVRMLWEKALLEETKNGF